MNRNEFLDKVWSRYPAVPDSSIALGRLQDVSHQEKTLSREKLQSDFIVLTVKNKPYLISSKSKSYEMACLLIENDWVALTLSPQGQLEVTLLAPHLNHNLTTRAEVEYLEKWSLFLKYTHDFFIQNHFLEMHTPTLVSCPGTEPTLEVFATELIRGSTKKKLFLPTSPELHLKKALHMGFEKIFEITKCFRNDEVTAIHQPEFWMIEWYRAFSPLHLIQTDVEKLVDYLVETFTKKGLSLKPPEQTITVKIPDLFKSFYNFDLHPKTSANELASLASQRGLQVPTNSSKEDIFLILFLEIEKTFDKNHLIFVHDYPQELAALARVSREGWAERFEAYWQGLELCNAFHELNDPKIQLERSKEDLRQKEKYGKSNIQLDEDFFKALQAGMPPSSGIALGLDRLFMALFGLTTMDKFKLFIFK